MQQKSINITLRPLTAADGDYLDEVSDERSFHYTQQSPDSPPLNPTVLEWDSPQRQIDRISFAILSDDQLVGEVSLTGIDLDDRIATVTMGIAIKANRNQSIGSTALHLILTYAFYSLGLNQVTAVTISTNPAAIRCLEKGGFKLTGTERYAVQMANLRVDRLHYAITADEFQRLDDAAL